MQSILSTRHSFIRLATFLIAFSIIITAASSQQTRASSAGNLLPPFDIASTWNVCQGYNNSKISHTGNDALSLDFTGATCDDSANGRTLHSPVNGIVYSYGASYGSLCIDTNDGRSVALIHINSSLTSGQFINAGQIVGSVAAPNMRGNGGIAHLHLQMWSMPHCYNSSPIPFDAAHNARICGAPNFSIDGPDNYNNGTWSGTTFTADTCSNTLPTNATPVYRFYSPITKHHLYTADQNEANTLKSRMAGAWSYEGVAYYVNQTTGCSTGRSVYRFYSQTLTTHLYTMDENEKSTLISNFPSQVWSYEGIAFCADKQQVPGTKPAYRFYSEQLKSHLYTTDENEKNAIIANFPSQVWSYEGISYYVY